MIELTERARVKSQEPLQQGQLILEIDGINRVFGAYEVKRTPRVGDDGLLIGDTWEVGGAAIDPNSYAYIKLDGSSSVLSQQINQDQGSGSVGSIFIELVDKAGELTSLIAGEVETDLLGRNAQVYFGFKDTAHPDDSVLLLSGVIAEIEARIGSYVFKIKHPEELKKTKLFSPEQGTLINAITASATSFKIDTGFSYQYPQVSSDPNEVSSRVIGLKYLKIDDEIMSIYIASNVADENDQYTIMIDERGALGTIAATHEAGAEFSTVHTVSGNVVELALALMLSQNENISVDIAIAINQIEPGKREQNALLFVDDQRAKHWLVVGDKVRFEIDGAWYFRKIVSFGESSLGHTIKLDSFPLPTLLTSTKIEYFSKYAVLPFGCGMTMSQVDVDEHEKIQTLFGSALFSYSFAFEDEIEAAELINEQIYRPSGCFCLPRKGKASMGIARAPIADEGTIEINSSNVLNTHELKITRSLNENFYNSVTYRYEYDLVEDKFYAFSKHISADSVKRIKTSEASLEIESKGLRRNSTTKALLDANAKRFLDRYKMAAELIPGVVVNQRSGFRVEVGDIVLFGDHMMNLADLKNGSRSFEPRLMEVQNKSFDLKTGRTTLDLLDTSFETNGRYGVIAPSSIIGAGSTSTSLKLKPVFSIDKTQKEKWQRYIGEIIELHSEDALGAWTRRAEATILGFDDSQPDTMIISELAFTPSAGDIVKPAPYKASAKQNRLFKALTCFINPSVKVVTGISSTQFTVSEVDAAKFLVGATVMLHNENYSSKTVETKVKAVEGTFVTVGDLGLIPNNTHTVELIGFIDGGKPYRFL